MATFSCVIEVPDEHWEGVLWSFKDEPPEHIVGTALLELICDRLKAEYDYRGPMSVTVNGRRVAVFGGR